MKLLFIGTGSIGMRHLSNVKALLGDNAEIVAYRHKDDEKTKELAEKYNAKSFFELDDALGQKPDAVFITNPTSLHMQTALEAAKRGIHIFMEKPISHNFEHVEELGRLIKEKNIVFFVGYDMRFLPSLRQVKKMIDDGKIGKILSARADFGNYFLNWKKEDDYRLKKDMGGGVLLDMSHEIDYMMWLFGGIKEVFSYTEKISSLNTDSDDFVEMLFKFENGINGAIHLDFIERKPRRTLRIIGENGTIEWDMNKGGEIRLDIAVIAAPDMDCDLNQAYIDEIKNFFNAIEGMEKVAVDFEHGKNVLRVVEAAKKSAREKRAVYVDEIYDRMQKPPISKGKTIAIICARGGSKGIPKKNIRLLAGKPLFAYAIEEARKSRFIDHVIVSTDDEEIAGIAKQYGAEVPFLRPKELAGDKIGKMPALQHAVKWLEDNENENISIVVDIDPTSPLKTVEDIDNCIIKLKETHTDAVETICVAHNNPYFNMLEHDEHGYLVYPKKTMHEITCRQDAPKVYDENSGVVASWRATIMEKGSYYKGRLLGVEMPKERSVMIDSEVEFKLAELMMIERIKRENKGRE